MQDNNEFEFEFTGARKHRQNFMQKKQDNPFACDKRGLLTSIKTAQLRVRATMFLYVCSTLSYGVRYFRCVVYVCVFALQ